MVGRVNEKIMVNKIKIK